MPQVGRLRGCLWERLTSPCYYIRKATKTEKNNNKNSDEEKDETSKSPSSQKNIEWFSNETDVDDMKNRRFIFDMIPDKYSYTGYEAGTLDSITNEVKMFLVEYFVNVQFPWDTRVTLRLQHSQHLDCPVIESVFLVKKLHKSAIIRIVALSGDVKDTLQVLQQMGISSFRLEAIHKKYIAGVRDFLSNNPFLRKLSVGGHYLKNDRDLVRDVIRSSVSLSTLRLFILKKWEFRKLKKPLLDRTSLNQHYLSHINGISHHPNLKTLDLTRTKSRYWVLVHPDAWIAVGNFLGKSSPIQYLDVSGHRISAESWKAIGEGLKANSSLLTFKAMRPGHYYKETETDILLPLFEALRDNKTLQSLDLSNYNLSDSFASLEALASTLIENRTLKSLVLLQSLMTDEGVTILSRSLPQMKGIEKLKLGRHECTVKGAQAFAEAMRYNYNLLWVNFCGIYSLPQDAMIVAGYIPDMGAQGFEKEFSEIEYYARMNRKGRRCIGSPETPVKNPSLWPLVLAKAQKKEEPPWESRSMCCIDRHVWDGYFEDNYNTSIDAVFYLLRDAMMLPIYSE